MPNPFPTVLAALALCTVAAAPSTARAKETVDVTLDIAAVLALAGPASTIIVGNPSLVEATFSDSQTLVLSGKSAGKTNLIVLGENGERIGDYTLHIVPPSGLTTLYVGSRRQTYSCDETCSPVLSVGDEGASFEGAQAQIRAREAPAPAAAPQ